MAHTPQNPAEDLGQTGSALMADNCARDILQEGQISTKFRAHLDSLTYSAQKEAATSMPRPLLQSKLTKMFDKSPQKGAMAVKTEVDETPRRSSQKRTPDDAESSQATPTPSAIAKKRRTTTKERSAGDPHNPVNNLVDSLRPDLILVFIGLNPGLMTAEKGHAYAHPSNLFWKLLHWSGVTPKRHDPSETRDLMDLYSIGNTNICARPTRTGDGLSKEELIEGAGILEEKIARYRPQTVCIVGKGIWDVIYKAKTGEQLKAAKFKYGWQDEKLWLGRTVNEDGHMEWAGSRTFVATTTSGLAAGMKPEEKTAIWKPLGDWFQQNRGEVTKKEEEDDEEVKVEE